MVRAGLLGIYGRENPGARHLAPGLLRAVRWRARVAFVVYLWPVTCSNATCWIRGIVTEEGQPVPGAPRLPLRAIATTSRRRSQAHSRGEAWTLSRQRTVTRFFRLKLSRAARRRVYTIGRLCSFPSACYSGKCGRNVYAEVSANGVDERPSLENGDREPTRLVLQASVDGHWVGGSLHKPVPWAPLAPPSA